MTPAAARASYRRQFQTHGETVQLRRDGIDDVDVLARVMGFQPSDVVGDVQQGERRITVLAEDIEASDFTLPFVPRVDRVVWNDTILPIMSVDDATRRIAGVQIAFDLIVAGA